MLVLFVALACKPTAPPCHTLPENGGDGALKLLPVGDDAQAGFGDLFCAEVDVFGVKIYATGDTPDDKVLHAAGVMAQYLDNDEDGEPDNSLVVTQMVSQKAAMVMFASESSAEDIDIDAFIDGSVLDSMALQDLYGSETHPGSLDSENFDASLEEVLHLVTFAGYANAYPDVFGEYSGTSLADAMDIARGGHFESVPSEYPEGAWYHYDDTTCDYACMVTEYIYWALTSHLGAQEQRCDDIAIEWELCTPDQLAETDTAIVELLTNPDYKFATLLPDGSYEPMDSE